MSDPVQIEGLPDGSGLGRSVAALEQTVSRAVEDLGQVAERMAEVETEGQATEQRARAAELQATEAIIRTTELMEQLEQVHRDLAEAHEGVTAAEYRAAEAERERTEAVSAAEEANQRAAVADRRAGEADERSTDAKRRASDAEHFMAEAEQHVRAAQLEVQEAEERTRAAEERSQAADERIRAAEDLGREAERRVAEMERREHELEQRAAMAEQRLAIAEQVRVDTEQRLADAERRASDAEGRAPTVDPDTERRAAQAEERLGVTAERARLLEEQIADLRSELARANARLEEVPESPAEVTVIVDRERSQLQEAVAAEVRRPLTSIVGLTLALKHHDPHSNDGREMVRQLGANARKLDRLVGELVDLDHLVDGSLQPTRRRTDLEALVRRVVEEIPDLANREVFVQVQHVAATVDPILTEQIVESLLANAGRRTGSGDSVWVELAPKEGGALVSVDDDGPQIPAGVHRTALDSLREDADGEPPQVATGIALVSRLAELQGGRAWIEERPGGGVSFRVFLPDVSTNGEAAPEDRTAAALAPELQGRPDQSVWS
ncbi:MAG TPA: ATP-binding protein [Actinomycetota bacterium]